MKNIIISITSEHPTVKFAAEELKKYLEKLNADIHAEITSDTGKGADYTLGVSGGTKISEDCVSVNISGTEGTIEGSNPRSVLFAVYRYLERLGIKWVRHGEDGEYIPVNHDFSKDCIHFTEKAKYKHRCMCTEGALSIEVALDNIDWCAKMGFNEYYVQGILPTFMFKRWYEHIGNPLLEKTNVTDEMMQDFKDRMEKEIKKRDLIYYTVGHGWHSEPFGVTSLVNTDNCEVEIPDNVKDLLAMLNGKRGIHNKRMANTHLCYSNPKARKGIVDYTVQYCKEHPDMDYVFFPLADNANNHCECEECSKLRPSDWYVTLMNELDAELEKEGIPAKIVVAVYCDFLWAPTQGKFNNPDRFIYVYAPFHRSIYMYKPQSRTSSGKYSDMGKLYSEDELQPYVRNKLTMPTSSEELISFLQSWQRWQDVDAYDHEYYNYVGEQYFDFGSIDFSEIIYDDIKELPKYKLNGMLACGTQRIFMPTGLGMWTLAKGLWNDEAPFENVKREYFDAAFGNEGQKFSDYFTYLSKLAHTIPEVPFDTVIETCRKMKEYIGTLDIENMSECHRASINYVLFHCDLIIKQMKAEKVTIDNERNIDAAEKEWKDLIHYFRVNEPSVHNVFDLYQYFLHLQARAPYPNLAKWWQAWDESDFVEE